MTGYNIRPSKWFSFEPGELWQYRELFYFMSWRDIKVKYKQTLLGFIWVILQPLALMFIFTILWTKVMKSTDTGLPYPLFAYSGLIFWGLFSSAITGSGESMISNSNIIKKVYFPRIIIPASAVITALFDFMVTVVILIFLLFRYSVQLSFLKFSAALLCSALLTMVSAFAIGLIISSATIRYRDFRYVLPFFIQALFFISPVIYPLGLITGKTAKMLVMLNPLAGAISLVRSSLSGSPADWNLFVMGSAVALFLLITGLVMFRRIESQLSDML